MAFIRENGAEGVAAALVANAESAPRKTISANLTGKVPHAIPLCVCGALIRPGGCSSPDI